MWCDVVRVGGVFVWGNVCGGHLCGDGLSFKQGAVFVQGRPSFKQGTISYAEDCQMLFQRRPSVMNMHKKIITSLLYKEDHLFNRPVMHTKTIANYSTTITNNSTTITNYSYNNHHQPFPQNTITTIPTKPPNLLYHALFVEYNNPFQTHPIHSQISVLKVSHPPFPHLLHGPFSPLHALWIRLTHRPSRKWSRKRSTAAFVRSLRME